jgi:hypothetical protein
MNPRSKGVHTTIDGGLWVDSAVRRRRPGGPIYHVFGFWLLRSLEEVFLATVVFAKQSPNFGVRTSMK